MNLQDIDKIGILSLLIQSIVQMLKDSSSIPYTTTSAHPTTLTLLFVSIFLLTLLGNLPQYPPRALFMDLRIHFLVVIVISLCINKCITLVALLLME
jgi:hypothetical protein